MHFITCSCYKRQPVLGSFRSRDLFLRVLEDVRRRYRFVVAGYVVIAEHFHMLISEPERGDPSNVMKALKMGFARRMIGEMARAQVSKGARPGAPSVTGMTTAQVSKGARPGAPSVTGNASSQIWQARFYDFNVWSAHKRVEKLRYIHRNPVKRGLVLEPEQWAWSSYRYYAYGEVGPVLVNEQKRAELKIRALERIPGLERRETWGTQQSRNK